ncbi:MAG: thioredoxin family protein [Bacteroidales bacterium]|nr:thioredoxin family protein [Bacteroidales bacterium]
MKLTIFAFIILLWAQYSEAQENTPVSEEEIVTGFCERSQLESGEFGKSFEKGHHDYIPDAGICAELKSFDEDYEIRIVLATWCHDSKVQVPRFFRILDDTQLSGKVSKIICVDRGKNAVDIDLGPYRIEKVPTFIVYIDDQEAGRITETPINTLEEDLLLILKSFSAGEEK